MRRNGRNPFLPLQKIFLKTVFSVYEKFGLNIRGFYLPDFWYCVAAHCQIRCGNILWPSHPASGWVFLWDGNVVGATGSKRNFSNHDTCCREHRELHSDLAFYGKNSDQYMRMQWQQEKAINRNPVGLTSHSSPRYSLVKHVPKCNLLLKRRWE